jgi:hypothetical protein
VIGVGAARTQQAVASSVPQPTAVAVKGPVSIDFTQEVARGFEGRIQPAVAGSWQSHQSLVGVTGVSFVPSKRLQAGTTYHVTITGLKRLGTGAAIPDLALEFSTEKPASVSSSTPAPNVRDVPVQPKLTLTLSQPNHDVRDLQATLEPAIPLQRRSTDDKTFVWTPKTALKQGQAYTFTVTDANLPSGHSPLVMTHFATVGPPGIKSARAGDHLAPGQTIDVVFDQPMKATTAFFDFAIEGKGAWVDERTWRFTPTGLKPGTAYSYKVKAGIPSAVGGLMETDQKFDITSNGAVTAGFSPSGQVAPNTPVRVAFDQPVDHASAESHFSVSPTVKGAFAWSGNTMTFTPTGEDYQTGYRYALAAGVVPNWGLPSGSVLGASVTTAPQLIQRAIHGITPT